MGKDGNGGEDDIWIAGSTGGPPDDDDDDETLIPVGWGVRRAGLRNGFFDSLDMRANRELRVRHSAS